MQVLSVVHKRKSSEATAFLRQEDFLVIYSWGLELKFLPCVHEKK